MIRERRRYLEFEQPLADLDEQISKLKDLKLQGGVDISNEIRRLEEKSESLLKKIFSDLSPYQKVQLSRHPDRPTSLQYAEMIFDDFFELKGDRNFREDASIVAGLAVMDSKTLMFIAHQKGKSTQENVLRNFGMPKPEGYRKALRLMQQAARWKLPIVTFVDTPGAYPGLDAEERGQAEAIAENILVMSGLRTPILTLISGEGGSGGALAIAVSDRLLMMEFSIYSVISPEGCAAITWKDPSFVARAAEALRLTARDVHELKIADKLVSEPLGGAHRDPFQSAQSLRLCLKEELEALSKVPINQLLEKRYQRFRNIGAFAQA